MWSVIIAYMVVQIGIGYWVSLRIKNEKDYLLAGQKLGLLLTTFSLFATWFGAETIVASSGAVAAEGLSGSRADPFGYATCLLLMTLFLAHQLRSRGYVTVVDFFRERFDARIEKIAVILMVPSSLLWGAAQIKAFGTVLSSFTTIAPIMGVLIATAVVVIYTGLGGLLGDVITDFLQGVVLIIGLGVLLYVVIDASGGLTAAIAGIRPEQLTFVGTDETFLMRLDTWLVPVLGSLVSQEILSRMLAAKSPQVARQSGFLAAGTYLIIGGIPVVIGLLGSQLVAVDDQDQFMILLTKQYLPPLMAAVFIGALISAILSTVDSTLLGISALVEHNMVRPWLKLKVGDKRLVKYARIVVLLAGIACGVMAAKGDTVYDLAMLSSIFGASGIIVAFLGGLWFKNFGGPYSALASLLIGFAITFAGTIFVEMEAPFVTSLALSIAGYVLMGWLFPKPAQVKSKG